MAGNEDYLDSLLKTVTTNEPSNDSALKKLADIQEEEKTAAMADELATMVNNLDEGDANNKSLISQPDKQQAESENEQEEDEDDIELDEDEIDFPELAALFEDDEEEENEPEIETLPETTEGSVDANASENDSLLDDATLAAMLDEDTSLFRDGIDDTVTAKMGDMDDMDLSDMADLLETVEDPTSQVGVEAAESDSELNLDGALEDIANEMADTAASADENAEDASAGSDSSETLTEVDENMSFEDIEALLAAGNETSATPNPLANLDDVDVTDLLDAMDVDGELGEINDLLKKSDNNEMISADDDIDNLLASMTEDLDLGMMDQPLADSVEGEKAEPKEEATPQAATESTNDEAATAEASEAEEEKPKKKLFGKKEKKAKEPKEEKEPKEKKKGFIQKLISLFMDEGDGDASDDAEMQQLDLSQENIAILESIDKEDPKAKKAKKEKKPKQKKEKKPKQPKPKKEKKPKQPKPKKEKPPKEPEKPLRPIGKKRIIISIIFGITVLGTILLFTSFIPNFMDKQNSKKAFEEGNYAEAYDLLVTKDLKGNDLKRFRGATLCLQMERQLDSYRNYQKLGMELEQLHALLLGVSKYQTIEGEAAAYGVEVPVKNSYLNILALLASEYQISEADAQELVMITDKVQYTKALKKILGLDYGMDFSEDAFESMNKDE